MKKKVINVLLLLFLIFSFSVSSGNKVYATETATQSQLGENNQDSLFGINISTSGETGGISQALQIVLTILALCPSILIMLTSFTRILIVMHFTRAALNTQSAPPNQILIGISIFLTIFIMSPVFNQIYENAYVPLSNNEITQEEALQEASRCLRCDYHGFGSFRGGRNTKW